MGRDDEEATVPEWLRTWLASVPHQVSDIRLQCRQSLRNYNMLRLGYNISEMESNISLMYKCLHSTNAEVRACAVDLLTDMDTHHEDFSETLKRLATEDPSDTVREHVFLNWTLACMQVPSIQIMQILCSICEDTRASDYIRGMAYVAIVRIDECTRRHGCKPYDRFIANRICLKVLSGIAFENLFDRTRLEKIMREMQ